MTVYLSIEQVLALHALQIRRFGGSKGLRDRGALEAALGRPQMTFGGDDLYGDVPSKAAAPIHSLVQNHPFVDGNERVGAHAMIVFLLANDHEPEFTPTELTEMTLALARGELAAEAVAIWIRQRRRRARRKNLLSSSGCSSCSCGASRRRSRGSDMGGADVAHGTIGPAPTALFR